MPVRVRVALLPPGFVVIGSGRRKWCFASHISSSTNTRTLVPLHDGSFRKRSAEATGPLGPSVAIGAASLVAAEHGGPSG